MSVELSIIMLDWEVREKFFALDWLNQQTVARDQYELIWVELRDRRVPEVAAKVDRLLTLGQKGLYRKHLGHNAGLAQARGRVVTMCDGDAVYPPGFVASVLAAFGERKVLMHHQRRSINPYPDGMALEGIAAQPFSELIPNTSACVSMLRRDAIGFGGLDEHQSYDGYWCGQNELAWRLINSGVPEVWCESLYLYHFRHPGDSGRGSSLEEIAPLSHHIDGHNATGVQAFKEGWLLPLVENPEIHRLRMDQRIIGSEFEKKYAW